MSKPIQRICYTASPWVFAVICLAVVYAVIHPSVVFILRAIYQILP